MYHTFVSDVLFSNGVMGKFPLVEAQEFYPMKINNPWPLKQVAATLALRQKVPQGLRFLKPLSTALAITVGNENGVCYK